MSTTTGNAEAKVQVLLDQRDLYVTKSRHERRLLACVKDLWTVVASEEEEEIPWLGFRQWLLDHNAKAVDHATVFISEYLEKNRQQSSCNHTVSLYIQSWRAWGISLSARIRQQIAQFDSEEWKPAQLTRRNVAQVNKLRQLEMLDDLWPAMVEYLSDATADDFRNQIKSVSSNRGSYEGGIIAASSFNELDVVARKTDRELAGILTCTLAYASLLRITGMRGLTGINVKLPDFTELDDGSVLLERWEKKLGSTRNVSKPVYCRIVPGIDPRNDPLVHIARHAVKVAAGAQVFGHGFHRRAHQDDEGFAKCPQRRLIAVLHTVAIACGSTVGLGERRLGHGGEPNGCARYLIAGARGLHRVARFSSESVIFFDEEQGKEQRGALHAGR